jgi:hypothetical protein
MSRAARGLPPALLAGKRGGWLHDLVYPTRPHLLRLSGQLNSRVSGKSGDTLLAQYRLAASDAEPPESIIWAPPAEKRAYR